MKKLAIGALSAGALAVAAVLGTSYYMGAHIQQALEDMANSWTSEDGFSVQVLEYDRGITHSYAKTLWSFASGEETYDLTVTHDIVHGPWAMGKAAKVVSRFVLPQDSEPQLLEALREKAPLEWTTTASWSGETAHTLFSPNFTTKFEDGSTLTWGGLSAQWTLSAQRTSAKGLIQMPVLRVNVEDGSSMDLEGTEITFDAHVPTSFNFWNGPSTMKVGMLAVHNTETQSDWKLQGLHIQSDSSLQDNLVQMGLDAHIAKVDVPEFSLGNMALEMHVKQVDATWLSAFLLWIQRNSENGDQSTDLLRSLPVLLAGKPEIAITRLALETAEGPAEMRARIAYAGKTPEALNPLTDLHIQMHAQVPKIIMAQLFDAKVRSDYLELLEQLEQEWDEEQLQTAVNDGVGKRLKSLLELGAIKDSGTLFSADAELKEGEFTLNGQPSELRNLLQMGGAI